MMARSTEQSEGRPTLRRAARAAALWLAVVVCGVFAGSSAGAGPSLAAAASASASARALPAATAAHDCDHAWAPEAAQPAPVGAAIAEGVACLAHCIALFDGEPAILAAAPSAPCKGVLAAAPSLVWAAAPVLTGAQARMIARAPPPDPTRPRLAAAIDPKTFRLRL